jgi:hypothetical protein
MNFFSCVILEHVSTVREITNIHLIKTIKKRCIEAIFRTIKTQVYEKDSSICHVNAILTKQICTGKRKYEFLQLCHT